MWHYDVIILLVYYITLEFPVRQMLWSSTLHQRYSLTKDADWWHHFDQVIHVYFTDWKSFLLASTKIERLCHHSTYSLVPKRPPHPSPNFGRNFIQHKLSRCILVLYRWKSKNQYLKSPLNIGVFSISLVYSSPLPQCRLWRFFQNHLPTPLRRLFQPLPKKAREDFVKGTCLQKFDIVINPRSSYFCLYSWLSITRILENSNILEGRTNLPVHWIY